MFIRAVRVCHHNDVSGYKQTFFALKSQKIIINKKVAVMFGIREDYFLLLNLVDVNSCEVDQNM